MKLVALDVGFWALYIHASVEMQANDTPSVLQ